MLDLDLDLSELTKYKDPAIKNIIFQLQKNGVAITDNDKISRQLSRALPDLRRNEILILAPDRRLNKNIIAFNPSLEINKEALSKEFKRLIKALG